MFSSLFDPLAFLGGPRPDFGGQEYTYEGKTYMLVGQAMGMAGAWYAILPNEEGVFQIPSPVFLIPHEPTRILQEDSGGTTHRREILRRLQGELRECSEGEEACAMTSWKGYKLSREPGQKEWPTLESTLCTAHKVGLAVLLDENPQWRVPNKPGEPERVVADPDSGPT
jgi:hypothetical protein